MTSLYRGSRDSFKINLPNLWHSARRRSRKTRSVIFLWWEALFYTAEKPEKCPKPQKNGRVNGAAAYFPVALRGTGRKWTEVIRTVASEGTVTVVGKTPISSFAGVKSIATSVQCRPTENS